jgi:hypothetical protein
VRYLFANPVAPEICPFLALALFFATADNSSANKQALFPSPTVEQSFTRHLSASLGAVDPDGPDPRQLGVDPVHRGATAYAEACADPWERYDLTPCRPFLRELRDGARHRVYGRTVAGLPHDSDDFALLPPHFPYGHELPAETNKGIDEALDLFAQNFVGGERGRAVARILLASIVYHLDWLRQELPPSSPVWNARLFTSLSFSLDSLKKVIISGDTSPQMRPTGMFASFYVQSAQRQLEVQREETMRAMKEVEATGKRIDALEARVGSTVQKVSIEAAIDAALDAAFRKFDELLRSKRELVDGGGEGGRGEGEVERPRVEEEEEVEEPPQQEEAAVQPAQQEDSSNFTSYTWEDGSLHAVPEGLDLVPKCTVREAWEVWNVGRTDANGTRFPPHRFLRPIDFSEKRARAHFSDLAKFCRVLDRFLEEKGQSLAHRTTEAVAKSWEVCLPLVRARLRDALRAGSDVSSFLLSTASRRFRNLRSPDAVRKLIAEMEEGPSGGEGTTVNE